MAQRSEAGNCSVNQDTCCLRGLKKQETTDSDSVSCQLSQGDAVLNIDRDKILPSVNFFVILSFKHLLTLPLTFNYTHVITHV